MYCAGPPGRTPSRRSIMSGNNSKARVLTARRLTLLASVGALGAAVLLAGPGGYRPADFGFGVPPAGAPESAMQHPVGFADIVAKVKPAVISVRVKIPAAAEPALLQQNRSDDEDSIPAQPGSPLEKFFQQFGGQPFGRQGRDGLPQGHQIITGEGSGFFITADGYAVTNNH